MADLNWYREAVAQDLTRHLGARDARHYAAVVVGGLSSRLHDLHAAEQKLEQLTQAVGRVLADIDAGDEVYANDLLHELKRAGHDVHAAAVAAAEETAELAAAEVEAVVL